MKLGDLDEYSKQPYQVCHPILDWEAEVTFCAKCHTEDSGIEQRGFCKVCGNKWWDVLFVGEHMVDRGEKMREGGLKVVDSKLYNRKGN